jgi:aldehyde dehydrogenase (NAD+)
MAQPRETIGATADANTYQNYIGGEWVAAASGETFENRNPANTRDLVGRLRAQAKKM